MVKRNNNNNGGFVYSTESGTLCPNCNQPLKQCICKDIADNTQPQGDGIVRIMRETKGRKGAGVTLIKNICLSNNELKPLAKELKKKCGCGGALKNGIIEIQGDVREQVMKLLEKKGFTVKICGG